MDNKGPSVAELSATIVQLRSSLDHCEKLLEAYQLQLAANTDDVSLRCLNPLDMPVRTTPIDLSGPD